MNATALTARLHHLPLIAVAIALSTAALLSGCHASSSTTGPVGFVGAGPLDFGPPQVRVRLRRVVAAEWSVPLSGLLDLDHPKARAAGKQDDLEPIEIAVYVVEHPEHGIWLLDSGVAAHFDTTDAAPAASAGTNASVNAGAGGVRGWLVDRVMGLERLAVRTSTRALLAQLPAAPSGVLLTHLHLDHVMGVADLPPATQVWAGPGGGAARDLSHFVTRPTIDAQLGGRDAVRELDLLPTPDGPFVAGLDLFGDGSLQVIHAPGHTPGHLAFLVRAVDGDHLVLGDASHTAWGWENGVPPGSYTLDAALGADSLDRLRAFAAGRDVTVHPGHQQLPAHAPARAAR